MNGPTSSVLTALDASGGVIAPTDAVQPEVMSPVPARKSLLTKDAAAHRGVSSDGLRATLGWTRNVQERLRLEAMVTKQQWAFRWKTLIPAKPPMPGVFWTKDGDGSPVRGRALDPRSSRNAS